MDMTTKIENAVMTKVCSMKPDKDSSDKKTITLKIKYDGLTLGDVLAKAVRTDVIAWQNGPGRSKFDKWENNQVVEIDASAPAKTVVDPMTQFIAEAKAAGIDLDDKEALTTYIMGRINK